MVIKDVRDAIYVARRFVLYDFRGLGGDYGTFEPISVKHDGENEIWIVVCSFLKEKALRKVKIKIDETSEEIRDYEIMGG